MYASAQHLPPFDTDDNSLGGEGAAELEAILAIPDSPAQYAGHPLVLAIYAVVSERGSWVGTAAELLKAVNLEEFLIGTSLERVDRTVDDLEYMLYDFDSIKHFVLESSQNGSVQHVFLQE